MQKLQRGNSDIWLSIFSPLPLRSNLYVFEDSVMHNEALCLLPALPCSAQSHPVWEQDMCWGASLENRQTWRVSAWGCWLKHSKGSSPLGDLQGLHSMSACWREHWLVIGRIGRWSEQGTQGVPYLALGLHSLKRKHPTLPCCTHVKWNFSLGKRKRREKTPWAQISVKITVTIVAHSFRSRQGCPHFILLRWPSSQRINGLFCNSHLTP